MYADTRSAINTLAQANDLAESIDSPWVGVAVEVSVGVDVGVDVA